MNKPVIILGAGGHAKVLIEMMQLQSMDIIGIIDKDETFKGEQVLGVPVLGDETVLDQYNSHRIDLVNGIGSTQSLLLRRSIYEKFSGKGFHFKTICHPLAIISHYAKLDDGVQIMAGAIIQPGCMIGDNTIINTGARIDHDCNIHAHVHVAPGATISGGVHIFENTHIGTGATIIQGIRIASGALIAAGAVVVNDIDDGQVVMGIPAKARQNHG